MNVCWRTIWALWMDEYLLACCVSEKKKFSHPDNLYNTTAICLFLSLLTCKYLLTTCNNLWAGPMVWYFISQLLRSSAYILYPDYLEKVNRYHCEKHLKKKRKPDQFSIFARVKTQGHFQYEVQVEWPVYHSVSLWFPSKL